VAQHGDSRRIAPRREAAKSVGGLPEQPHPPVIFAMPEPNVEPLPAPRTPAPRRGPAEENIVNVREAPAATFGRFEIPVEDLLAPIGVPPMIAKPRVASPNAPEANVEARQKDGHAPATPCTAPAATLAQPSTFIVIAARTRAPMRQSGPAEENIATMPAAAPATTGGSEPVRSSEPQRAPQIAERGDRAVDSAIALSRAPDGHASVAIDVEQLPEEEPVEAPREQLGTAPCASPHRPQQAAPIKVIQPARGSEPRPVDHEVNSAEGAARESVDVDVQPVEAQGAERDPVAPIRSPQVRVGQLGPLEHADHPELSDRVERVVRTLRTSPRERDDPDRSRHSGHHTSRRIEPGVEAIAAATAVLPSTPQPASVAPRVTEAHDILRRYIVDTVEQLSVTVANGTAQVRLELKHDLIPGTAVVLQQTGNQVEIVFECAVAESRGRIDRVAPAFTRTLARRLGREVVVLVRSVQGDDAPALEFAAYPDEDSR
jgi:hypothetical protein